MTFFPVGDEKAFDAAVIRAGNAAFGLWARAGSYTADKITGGYVPPEVALLLGTQDEIDALVREKLWTREKTKRGGYLFVDYTGPTIESETNRKAAQNARARRSRYNRSSSRRRHNDVTRDTPRDAAPDVTRDSQPPISIAITNAAAAANARARDHDQGHPAAPGQGQVAASGDPDPLGLPASATAQVAVDILASAAAAAGLVVRWDTLTPDEVTEVAALVDVHGDNVLVDAARRSRSAHSTPPASARAWLNTWRALPPPGRILAAVPEQRCPEHDTEPARTCRACAADRKAGQA